METAPSRIGERVFLRLLAAAAALSTAAVLSLLLFLGWFCLPLSVGGNLGNVFSWDWQPFQGAYGILPMVAGSLLLSGIAMSISFPAALAICCFVHGLGPPRPARWVLAIVHLMTGIPTILYAFVSAMLLVPLMRQVFGGSGYSLLTAALVLSVLILPTLVLLIHSAWLGAAPRVRMTCAALGLTRAQELFRVLVPVTRRALLGAGLLGFGRAIGDTMVALLLSGNAAQFPGSPFESMRALTAHVALVLATDSQDSAYASVFAAGLILLLMTAAFSMAARGLRSHGTRA